MRLNTFLLIASLVAIVFALGFLLAPAQVPATYGIQADAQVAMMGRFFGAALFHLDVAIYLLRNVVDPDALRGLVVAGIIGTLLGLLVALHGQLSAVVNALGWSTVLIYALLAAGYASFLRKRP
jgi:hypothetical protein